MLLVDKQKNNAATASISCARGGVSGEVVGSQWLRLPDYFFPYQCTSPKQIRALANFPLGRSIHIRSSRSRLFQSSCFFSLLLQLSTPQVISSRLIYRTVSFRRHEYKQISELQGRSTYLAMASKSEFHENSFAHASSPVSHISSFLVLSISGKQVNRKVRNVKLCDLSACIIVSFAIFLR